MTRLINFITIIAIAIIVGILGCDRSSTKSGNSDFSDSICNDLSINNNAPSYPFECDGISKNTMSNIQHDNYNRRISWNFKLECLSSDNVLYGRYYNLIYNSNGQLQSFDATIDGTDCSYP